MRSLPRHVALPWRNVLAWGVAATAITQTLYLGHGDQGLLANIQLAMIFSLLGGIIASAWLLIARQWDGWRTRERSRHAY
jgi:hypothetical protein